MILVLMSLLAKIPFIKKALSYSKEYDSAFFCVQPFLILVTATLQDCYMSYFVGLGI
ncbi:hypothetical protein BC952_0500 [Flavobacterium limicola]|uniref:Uncharacterized protein n=1 Tax=Flavobacterium limicola TaxID=180441 RepID=A0A495S5D1_9FLAO|nr:hypothetical protein BC952_0500 [Flavobacterium limicola]